MSRSDVIVLHDGSFNGPENMKLDIALLDDLQGAVCSARVYSWDGPWVTLGRFQNRDRALKADSPVPSVTRPTGGKAVLHGHDITLGIAARLDWLNVAERRISVVYRVIISPIVAALNRSGAPCALGVSTRFADKGIKSADCFAHVSPNDIVNPETGQKVCGCALRVTDSAVLVQASIPIERPLVDPSLVFDVASECNWSCGIDSEVFAQTLLFELQGLEEKKPLSQ